MQRVLGPVLVAALALTGCAEAGSAGPEMGNATTIASPPTGDVDGEVLEIGQVDELVSFGDDYAIRVGDELLVGSLEDFRQGDHDSHDISGCTDVTSNGEDVVIACGNTVRILGDREVQFDEPIHSAVLTSTGELIAASSEEAKVWVDGETFDVAHSTDELLVVPVEGQPDSVLRINRENTTIQDVRWTEGRQGGTLRVGLGVGTMSAGDDGLAIVSDTMGDQIAIYTAYDVVRLQQTSHTGDGPWAVAWDGEWAWAASNAENLAYSYSISGGVPVPEETVGTVANVRAMIATQDVLLFGGDGLQIVER